MDGFESIDRIADPPCDGRTHAFRDVAHLWLLATPADLSQSGPVAYGVMALINAVESATAPKTPPCILTILSAAA